METPEALKPEQPPELQEVAKFANSTIYSFEVSGPGRYLVEFTDGKIVRMQRVE